MKIGDLVDDGFDCIGIIVKLGWYSSAPPIGMKRIKERSYLVHFLVDTTQNGWYSDNDLEVISESR